MIASRALAATTVLAVAFASRAQAQPVPDTTALEVSGQRHYELAEYTAAIADFKEAFRITDQPELLFDIAQAYRLSGDCKQAQTFYRTYLRRVPDAANADKVVARIAEMDACPAPTTTGATTITTTAPASPPPPPPLPHRVRTWKTWAGLAAIGAGAVGIGLGAMFAVRGANKTDELRDACAASCSGTAARELEAQGRAANRNAAISFAVGGALVATGVVLVILDRRSRAGGEHAAGPAVSLAGGGAIAGWTWGF